MCQIIHSADGSIPSDLGEMLRKELEKNRHGAGIMVIMEDPCKVHTNWWFKQKEKGWTAPIPIVKWLEAKAKSGKIREWAIHCRMATHGDKSLQNCHPFQILASGPDDKGGVFMHNGVFTVPTKGNESDTAAFAEMCIGKNATEIGKLLEKHGNGSRLLLLMYGVDAGFQRLGSWELCDTTTHLYTSTSPAMYKYRKLYRSDNTYNRPYFGSNTGHSERTDFDSWKQKYKEQFRREDMVKATGDHSLVLLPKTDGCQYKDSDLPEGIKLNTDGLIRQVVMDALDKHNEYRDLERLLVIAALGKTWAGTIPDGLLPTLDACACYIGRLRSALGRVLHKQEASQLVIAELKGQLEAAQKVQPFKMKDYDKLLEEHNQLLLDYADLEYEVADADRHADSLLCGLEVKDRIIRALTEVVGRPVIDAMTDKYQTEVDEEYRPLSNDTDPSQEEIDEFCKRIREEAEEKKGAITPIQRSIKERETVKIPKELDVDVSTDTEQEAIDAIDQEVSGASVDASYEG